MKGASAWSLGTARRATLQDIWYLGTATFIHAFSCFPGEALKLLPQLSKGAHSSYTPRRSDAKSEVYNQCQPLSRTDRTEELRGNLITEKLG